MTTCGETQTCFVLCVGSKLLVNSVSGQTTRGMRGILTDMAMYR